MRNLYTLICCCLILLGNNFANAQIVQDSILQLQQVEILTTNEKSIIPVQELKGEQLRALNSHSVADAVRYFAGVQLKDYGGVGGLKTIDVRGMGTQQVGVFYDGIQLGNAQNGIVDLGKFSFWALHIVEMSSNAMSVKRFFIGLVLSFLNNPCRRFSFYSLNVSVKKERNIVFNSVF